jgi:hypothetical protein
MEDLASQADFARAEALLATWTTRVSVAIHALVMGGIVFVLQMPWTEPPQARQMVVMRTLAVCLLFGAAVAVGRHATSHRAELREADERLARVFENDPEIVPPGPQNATHRLLCAVALRPGHAVGGFLYVTASTLVFQQHYLRPSWRSWYRSELRLIPEPLTIGPAPTITLESVGILPSRLGRLVFRRLFPGVLIRWGEGYSAAFHMVQRDETSRRLQSCLDAQRRGNSTGV